MTYRHITVDGKTYDYVVGRSFLKIKDVGVFPTSQIGNPIWRCKKLSGKDAYGRRLRGESYEVFVVTPETVKRVIKGESLPEVLVCEKHGVRTTRLTTDPYSAEIEGKSRLMIDCEQCVQISAAQAAEGLDSMKGTLRDLAKLRVAGLARGPSPLLPPHSAGRYTLLREPRPARPMVKASK